MSALRSPEFPPHQRAKLRVAVQRAIEHQAADSAAPSLGSYSLSGRLPAAARLGSGAEQIGREHPEDADAARYFVALLEAAFLIAAADGISPEEQNALAELIVQVTGSRVAPVRLEQLFSAFAEQAEQAGLGPRLDFVAQQFADFVEREEALSFVTLVALADGHLGGAEAAALVSLGERFDFSKGEVQAVIDQVAQLVGHYLH